MRKSDSAGPAGSAGAAAEFHSALKKTGLTSHTVRRFRNLIYRFYRDNARDFLPWRSTDDPYHILVSEIMLQQTQIERVLQKYPLLIGAYPDFRSLADAPLRSLYAIWQGMGYNRRALALRETAARVMQRPYCGRLPSEAEELVRFPGIGNATAGAVAAFAFRKPAVFIETNIRRVFIHFFFPGESPVSDRDILPLIAKTLDRKDPRSWYYGLMDYGTMLRGLTVNPNRKSAHYGKQSPFSGSNRQLRGNILRLLADRPLLSGNEAARLLNMPRDRTSAAIEQLFREGFIRKTGSRYTMA